MGIQSKDLLDQLADMQLALEGFSLEKLTIEEAQGLKSSFEALLLLEDAVDIAHFYTARVKDGNFPCFKCLIKS